MWKDGAYAQKRSTPRVQDSQAKTQGRYHYEKLEDLKHTVQQHQRRQR